MTSPSPDVRTQSLLRELAPQVIGAVIRRFRDFSAAEDAVQEALIAAAAQWPRDGIPDNPRGWLIQVALRRMTDHVRSEISRRTRESADASALSVLVAPVLYSEPELADDDTLALLFICCHPVLPPSAAIALTLRAVGGLTTAEIARAFLVPEPTLAQRISRAKQTIKDARVPNQIPDAAERQPRLGAVLHVLYLIFNEGYTSSAGDDLQRPDLAVEAIRLTRSLHALVPENGEIEGLLALMLLTDARRAARAGASGELVPLDEQDRTRWNQPMIAEGMRLVSAALKKGQVGEYQLQAAISAVHDEAARAEETDWAQILALYGVLRRITDNPLVKLNHAVAIAMVHGPEAGLELLHALVRDGQLEDHHRLDATRAHLLERAGQREQAASLYRAAAEKTANMAERNYLQMRAARLREASGG